MKLFFLMIFVSTSAFAALDIKTGLWKIDMLIKTGGKEINPAAQMQKVMANMPEAQKKRMREMMGKLNPGFSDNGETNICYSKEMLNNPKSLAKHDNGTKRCETTIVTFEPKKIVSTFKCVDGASGEANWSVNNSESYTGLVNLKNAKGEKSVITYTGKFLKADCGKVKPVL